jgi:hypothetical protein
MNDKLLKDHEERVEKHKHVVLKEERKVVSSSQVSSIHNNQVAKSFADLSFEQISKL